MVAKDPAFARGRKPGPLRGIIPWGKMRALSNLLLVSVAGNEVSGPVLPPTIFRFPKLKEINFMDNKMVGPIPNTLSALKSLQKLDVSMNRITGPIPPGVSTLTALTSLAVSYNQMTGALLPGLGNLRQLRTLDLGGNKFQGAMPASWDTNFGGVCKLNLGGMPTAWGSGADSMGEGGGGSVAEPSEAAAAGQLGKQLGEAAAACLMLAPTPPLLALCSLQPLHCLPYARSNPSAACLMLAPTPPLLAFCSLQPLHCLPYARSNPSAACLMLAPTPPLLALCSLQPLRCLPYARSNPSAACLMLAPTPLLLALSLLQPLRCLPYARYNPSASPLFSFLSSPLSSLQQSTEAEFGRGSAGSMGGHGVSQALRGVGYSHARPLPLCAAQAATHRRHVS
ncbi:unnamed protein product [Closterium sp. Naga37s-1]|nr:unnamed protein product [Closterium sp. Naga37s-1]